MMIAPFGLLASDVLLISWIRVQEGLPGLVSISQRCEVGSGMGAVALG